MEEPKKEPATDDRKRRFARVAEIFTATLPAVHLDRARPMVFLGKLLSSEGDVEGATPLLEEALEIRRAKLGPDHISSTQVRDVLRSLVQ